MPGRIRWVGWRSLRKRLREQVAAVADVAEIECHRVEDDVEITQFGFVRGVQQIVFQQMSDSASGLRPMAKVDEPLLVPNRIDRGSGHSAQSCGNVRPAECTERLLLLKRSNVRTLHVCSDSQG